MPTPTPDSPFHPVEKLLRDAQDYWFAVYSARPGDVIVDVGAGRGEDTLAFSRAVGPEGLVWAIEPHPDSYALLERFVIEQRLTNIRTIRAACTDQPRELQIETMPVWESNFVRDGQPSLTSHAVRGIRLDDLCAELAIDRIDYLKMNIEGAERSALPGAPEVLRRARFVTIAAHDFRADRGEGESFRTLAFVKEALRDAGFQLHIREQDPRYYVPYHVHGFRPPAGVA